MDQQQDTTGLSLPQPSAQGQFSAPQQNVAMPPSPYSASQPVAPMLSTAPAQPPNFIPAQPLMPPSPGPLSQPQAPVVAEPDLDDDALDTEWVQKARAIVEQTHNDPYAESNALSQVRADYLKRRYGKEMKSSEK